MGALVEKYHHVNSHVPESNNEKKLLYIALKNTKNLFTDGGLAIILYQKGLS